MKKVSVVLKLFGVTSLVMLSIFALILAAQSVFFERFYQRGNANILTKIYAKTIFGTKKPSPPTLRSLPDNSALYFYR